jgi:uncharacterized protein (TIGR02246 family)
MQLRHLLLSAPALLFACAPRADVAAEEEAIRAMSAAWQALDKEKDAAGVAALFADDGQLHWQERDPISGRAAVEEFIARNYAENPGVDGGFGPDRILVATSGDLAVEQGAWQDGENQGRYMTVYQKAGDDWKVAADMSLNTNPNGGAPDWAVEQLTQWYDAFNARDARRLSRLYSTNAKVTDAQGRAALMARWEAEWAESESQSCSGGYDGFQMVGSIAAGWGRDTCEITPLGGGAVTVERSRWLAVLEPQADGSWLLIRDFGESVEP